MVLLLAGGCADPAERVATPQAVTSKDESLPPAFTVSTDAVLLITGSTNGMLELCDCGPPMPAGLARRSGLLQRYRQAFDRTVTLDTGDFFWIDPAHVRNLYLARGYRMLGYDCVAMGDQDLSVDDRYLVELASGPDRPILLTGNIRPLNPPVPVKTSYEINTAGGTITVLSYAGRDAFTFFDQQRLATFQARWQPQAITPAVQAARRRGSAVIVIVHSHRNDVHAVARTLQPDLILWGHFEKSLPDLLHIEGVPTVRVGGAEHLAAVALDVEPGRIAEVDYRLELIDHRWHADPRLIDLYQHYVQNQGHEKNEKRKKPNPQS